MLVAELLNEDLGNLKKLNAGPLVKAMFGSVSVQKGDKHVDRDKLYSNWGPNSKITDVGEISNWAQLKKALNSTQDANAFVLYLNGKAVFFMMPNNLDSRAQEQRAAYDRRAFETPEENKHRTREKPTDKWAADDWERQKSRGKFDDYDTDTKVTNTWVKEKIEKLIAANGKGSVTAKIISADRQRSQKHWARDANQPENFEKFTGIKGLQKRLSAFKLSKDPTAEDLEKFFKMALGRTPKIRYDGLTYQLGNDFDTSSEKVLKVSIFRGKPFHITYKPVQLTNATFSEMSQDEIIITMKFYPEEMMMRPIAVEHKVNSSTKKGSEKVFDKEAFVAKKLNIDVSKLTPKVLVAHFDKLLASSVDSAAAAFRTLEKSGLDWPEVKDIEKKVSRAMAKDRLGKLHDGSVKSRLDD